MYKGIHSSMGENRMKSILLMILFPVLLYFLTTIVLTIVSFKQESEIIGFGQAWQNGLYMTNDIFILLGPIILVWGIISFLFYRQIVFKFAGAKPITRKENPEIYNIVENLCISKGLPVPNIGIIEENGMNAFATGWRTKDSWIVFSRGLLNRLDKKEIEAVAAHELTHIINKDSLMMIVVVVFVGVIGTLGQILIRFSGRSRDSKGGNVLPLIGLVLIILGYLVYPLIQLALSRRREFLADAGSVYLTKDKYSMISALQKISQNSQISSINKKEVAAMCIESPISKKKKSGLFKNLFSTHPSVEDRIKALESY